MLGRGVNRAILTWGPDHPWGNVVPVLQQADLRIINLECVITKHKEPWGLTPKVFFFRANPLAVKTLKLAHIDYVALANNHTLDFKEEGLLEMLNHLDKAGIARSGARQNFEAASSAALIHKKGIKIGILSITDNEPVWKAGKDKSGTFYLPIDIDTDDFQVLKSKIEETRRKVDILVLSTHWGPNMVERPSSEFQEFAKETVDAGVDIFHGHSSHIFQGIEIYKNKLIMYDTGDFVDDYIVDPFLRNDLSFIFLVKIDKGARIIEVELVPTAIDSYQVNLATGEDANWSLERMEKLTNEFDTAVLRQNNQLFIKPVVKKAA